MNVKDYEQWLKKRAFELLSNAFNETPPEILFINSSNVRIHVPKYFYDIINNGNSFKYRGYTVEIGYENAIVFFDKEYGFINNRIFKYSI